jgi:hypothetical protein
MATPRNQPPADTDRVDLDIETQRAARQTLLSRNPAGETDIIAADQFVKPGEKEFTPEPPPQPQPRHGHSPDRSLQVSIRMITMVGILAVIVACVFLAAYIMQL